MRTLRAQKTTKVSTENEVESGSLTGYYTLVRKFIFLEGQTVSRNFVPRLFLNSPVQVVESGVHCSPICINGPGADLHHLAVILI